MNWTVGCLRFPFGQWGCGFLPSCTRRFPLAWAGARHWVVDTAGHGGGSILQGLFWAPDLLLL